MNKNESFHRVKSIKVTSGFLIGLHLAFALRFSAIIGGRGGGKSTLLALMIWATKSMPGREGDRLRKRIQSLIENNLNGGRVELEIETKDGLTYFISRAAGEEPVLLDANRKPVPVDPASAQLFALDIYSQNQIESIAENPHYQLDLLDKFAAEPIQAVRRQLAETVRQLESNAASILPLLSEKAAIEAELSQTDAIQEKLKGVANISGDESGPVNRAHALKALRHREERALEKAENAIAEHAADVQFLIGSCDLATKALFGSELPPDSPNHDLMDEALADLRSSLHTAENSLKKAVEVLKRMTVAVQKARGELQTRHVEQEMEFQKLIEAEQQNQAQSAERVKLERQYNELLLKKSRRTEVDADLAALDQRRQKLMAQLSEERDNRFSIRDGVAKMLNERLMPQIRVSFEQYADKESFRKWLENSLRPANIQNNVVAGILAERLGPAELAGYVRQGDPKAFAVEADISLVRATAVIGALRHPEKIMELDTIDMDEMPTIELNDNGTYKNSDRLSTGQKCTAVLPILMFESVNPLIIDQPEDNLDNSYVFHSVVPAIHQAKEHRQLIFVTHNPNIPVLGGADLVVVMESDGHKAKPKKVGTVDECHDEIIDLLEGGEEAYRLRGEIYERMLREAKKNQNRGN